MNKEEIVKEVLKELRNKKYTGTSIMSVKTAIDLSIEETAKEIIKIIKESHYITGDEEVKAMIEIYRNLLVIEIKKEFVK